MTGCLAVPDLVERPDRRVGHQPARDDRRRAETRVARQGVRRACGAPGELVTAGVLAAGQHRPPQPAPPGDGVDPGHRVGGGGVGLAHRGHQRREVVVPVGVDADPSGLDRDRPERRRGEDPGQPHAADGRPEQLRVVVGADDLRRAVGGDQVGRDDVGAEGAGPMVALAVHVAGDRAADGDVPGPRGDREEPARGQQQPHQVVQGGAGRRDHVVAVASYRTGQREQHDSPGVLGGVAVGPAEPPRDQAAGARRTEQGGEVLGRGGHGVGHHRRGPAPAGEGTTLSHRALRDRPAPATPRRSPGARGRPG